jgi:hypothetical protein
MVLRWREVSYFAPIPIIVSKMSLPQTFLLSYFKIPCLRFAKYELIIMDHIFVATELINLAFTFLFLLQFFWEFNLVVDI